MKFSKKTLLFHGTSADFGPDEIEGPAWFSESRNTAERFVRWHDGDHPRILKYQPTKTLNLLQITSKAQMDKLIWEAGVDDHHELAQNLDAKWDGWIIPNNYGYEQSDILICDPATVLKFLEEARC